MSRREAAYEWHRKMGQLGAKNMKRLVKLSKEIFLEVEKIDETTKDCEICSKAKQIRTPFNQERRGAKRSLELIHTDICGSINSSTWERQIRRIIYLLFG